MNPFLSKELASEHIRDLREAANGARSRAEQPLHEHERIERLSVRPFAERDIDAVRLLAALDSKPLPGGAVLVAEQSGEVVAALTLDSGDAVADPFKPTANAVALLRLRAKQLKSQNRGHLTRWNHLHMPRGRLAA